MNKYLLNTQIESLTPQHGAEIVEFYEQNGFDTGGMTGALCKKEGDPDCWYGVDIDGVFFSDYVDSGRTNITLEQANKLAKVTTEETFDYETANILMDLGYKVRNPQWYESAYIYKKGHNILDEKDIMRSFLLAGNKWELYKDPKEETPCCENHTEKFPIGPLPEGNTTVSSITATYVQEEDCWGRVGEDYQELKLEILAGDDGPYYVLSSERWAFDSIEELIELLYNFKKKGAI